MADTRTFRNYAESLQIGPAQYVVGANERRVPSNSRGLPPGGTTGQVMIKLSDEDYDAGWTGQLVLSIVAGTGITVDNADPRNPVISADASSAVTSVGMSVPAGFAVAGSPVTSTGTFTVTYASGYQGYTSAEASKLAGISAGADVTANALLGLPTKSTPVDADYFGIIDSAASNALKALTWANVKATLKTYFDAIYGALATANQWAKTQRGTIVSVAPAATMTLNLNDGQEFRMSAGLNQNATVQLSNADSHVGAKFSFTGYNNGTGGFTLSYGTGLISIGGASPTAIPTGANAKWRIDGQIVAPGEYQFTSRGVGV